MMTDSKLSRRRLLRTALGVAATPALAAVLAACGSSGPAAPAAQSQPTSAPAAAKPTEAAKPAAQPAATTAGAAQPAAAAKASGVELTYLNQSRGQFAAVTELAKRYGEQTGVTVNIDSPGPVDYPQKLQAAVASGSVPDTYYAIGAADMAPYFKAGWALNLKPELDQGWNKNFTPNLLSFNEFLDGNPTGVPPGIYQAPWEVTTYGTLFNPAHLQKAGLDGQKTPASTAEMLDMLKKIKAANVGPFVTAYTYIPLLTEVLASNWLSDQQIDDARAGKGSYKDDAWKQALQFFVDLRDNDLISNNTMNDDAPTNEKSFFNVQEVAMFWTSVVSVPVQVTTAPDFTAYSAFPFPKVDGGKMAPRTIGGTGKNGVVNPKGKNVDESLKYIKWLTEKEQEQTFAQMVPLVPMNPAALDPSKVSPQIAVFAGMADKVLQVRTPLKGAISEAFYKGVQAMLIKQKSVDDILNDVDNAQKG